MTQNAQSNGFFPEQLKEYASCPQVLFLGAHSAGLKTCVYCAQIYRRYHKLRSQEGNTVFISKESEEPEQNQAQQQKPSGVKSLSVNPRLDDDDDDDHACTNIMCARAGWCMCT